MRLRPVQKKDYPQLVLHCKNVLNYYNFFEIYNDDLNTGLATYSLHNLLTACNYGLVIEYNNIIVGVLLAKIPHASLTNIYEYDDLKDYGFDASFDPSLLTAEDMNQEEIKRLEIMTNNMYSTMLDTYQDLVEGKSEILLFSVLPKHRGRGLSEILMNRFKYDTIEYGCSQFYLYTTTLCDYQYYEHKKFQYVKEVLINTNDMNDEQSKFLQPPVYSIIYYTDALNPPSYDGVAEEIIQENQEE